jgi:uncharacterized membrane protein
LCPKVEELEDIIPGNEMIFMFGLRWKKEKQREKKKKKEKKEEKKEEKKGQKTRRKRKGG